VLEQQLSLNSAEAALLRVLVELRTQRVNLYLALGGDFGTAVPTSAESSHTP